MEDFEYDPYYRWWYSVEKAGVPLRTITEYYENSDPEALFRVNFNDTEYTYSLLSRDEWQWCADSAVSSFVFNKEIRQTDYEWYYISSSISRMAYASDEVSVETVDEIEDYVWNGELYTVNTYNPDTNEFELILSDFYSVLSSSEPFIGEMNSVLYNNNVSRASSDKDISALIDAGQFPIRDSEANTLSEIISKSSETEFPIGGTHPVILKTENGYECLVSKRSTEVQSWPEYWTIVPAGYFAPDGIDSRLGVLDQFYSEYCEELFNAEEGSVSRDSQKIREAELHKVENKSEYVVTGVGVDGLSLSFELSGLYLVSDSKIGEQMKEDMDFNYEVSNVEFLDLDNVEKVESFLTPDDVTPPSAFAFVNALKYLKEKLPVSEQPDSVKLIE